MKLRNKMTNNVIKCAKITKKGQKKKKNPFFHTLSYVDATKFATARCVRDNKTSSLITGS